MLPVIEDFILSQEEKKQWVLFRAHELIMSAAPGIESIWRYKTPFYDHNGMMLYLTVFQKKKVVLGFCDGSNLEDPLGLFSALDRKQIRHIDLTNLTEDLEEKVRLMVQIAWEYREKNGKIKKGRIATPY